MKTITRILASAVLLAASPAIAQQADRSGAVFALMDRNEWCPGGSVYLDLRSGAFLLYPVLPRPACTDPETDLEVERGTLGEGALRSLRTAYEEARRAGLRRRDCDVIISNGGPEALVITGPSFSARTPEEEGCWSEEAIALHGALFELFAEQRRPR